MSTFKWTFLKALTLTSVMLFTTIIHAQSPDTDKLPSYITVIDGRLDKRQVSMPEAQWFFFSVVSGAEDKIPGNGQKLLRQGIGLPDAAAESFFYYIRSSIDDVKSLAYRLTENACISRKGLETSPSELANTLVEIDNRLEQERNSLVAGVVSVLDRASQLAVTNWVDANLRGEIQLTKFDHRSYLSSGNVDLRLTVNRLCGSVGTFEPR